MIHLNFQVKSLFFAPKHVVHIFFKKSEFILEETRSCKKSKMVGKRNIQEDEIVAEEVRKYPCLYDKSDSGYKERER